MKKQSTTRDNSQSSSRGSSQTSSQNAENQKVGSQRDTSISQPDANQLENDMNERAEVEEEDIEDDENDAK